MAPDMVGQPLGVGYRQTAKLAEEEKPLWFSLSIGANVIVATRNTGSLRIDVTRAVTRQALHIGIGICAGIGGIMSP